MIHEAFVPALAPRAVRVVALFFGPVFVFNSTADHRFSISDLARFMRFAFITRLAVVLFGVVRFIYVSIWLLLAVFHVHFLGQRETVVALAFLARAIATLKDLADGRVAPVPHERLTLLIVLVSLLDHEGLSATWSVTLDHQPIVDRPSLLIELQG